MAAHGGPFDLTLLFGYRMDPATEPELQVAVTMSWEHAAVMAKALQVLVDNYEEQVGALPDLAHVRLVEER